ncbi:MAG: metallophosphoesterase [Oscillospiraceae bacterium]|nr:metallophosphoesterase [Oscillospiraceae bacterium]
MKKITALILCTLFLFTSFSTAFAETILTPAEKAHLHFNDEGSFRILNFSDFQDNANLSNLTVQFIKKSVEKYNPDVIVLTGDNIAGYTLLSEKASEKAIREFMDVFEELGIPVAIVFGNHDDEGKALSKQEQMKIYNEYSVSISIDEADYYEDLSGVGTYYIPVYESASSNTVKFVLWMFDSGSDDEVESACNYDHVHADQIDWYKRESARINAENGGTVYGLEFQHIVVKEIYDAFEKAEKNSTGAYPYLGKWYKIPSTAAKGSILGEAPCPSYESEGLFEAFKETGNILATVAGHDHANAYVIPYNGIDIICTPTSGFSSYGKNETRGARVFDIDMNNPGEYETHMCLFTDFDYNNIFITIEYKFVSFWKEIFLIFNNLWVLLRESFS